MLVVTCNFILFPRTLSALRLLIRPLYESLSSSYFNHRIVWLGSSQKLSSYLWSLHVDVDRRMSARWSVTLLHSVRKYCGIFSASLHWKQSAVPIGNRPIGCLIKVQFPVRIPMIFLRSNLFSLISVYCLQSSVYPNFTEIRAIFCFCD